MSMWSLGPWIYSLPLPRYVHNHTRDITATRPENFAELSEEECQASDACLAFASLPGDVERLYAYVYIYISSLHIYIYISVNIHTHTYIHTYMFVYSWTCTRLYMGPICVP